MISGIGSWIRSIAGAAVICGLALALTPQSKVKEVLKILCGVVVVIALVAPLTGKQSAAFSMDLSQYRVRADEITGLAEKEQTNLKRSIIEQEFNSYILDKAQTLGVENISVNVALKWGDEGFWYPYEVSLTTNAGISAKNSLSAYIEGELGIPAARQYWSEVTQDEG